MILLNFLIRIRVFFELILGPALPTLKLISILLSLAFLIAIIWISVKAKYVFDLYDVYTQIFRGGNLHRKDSIRGWKKVLRLIRSNDSAEWRKALELSVRIFDEVLKLAGYRGTSLYERLEQVTPEVVKNIEALRQAHAFAERVSADPAVVITKKEVVGALRSYREAFRDLQLLD